MGSTIVNTQDLTQDKLLVSASRQSYEQKPVPAIGGIPLLAKLGQGGMGAVYVGIHPRLKQEVAVKVLPYPLLAADPEMVKRFYREAQIAAKVKSPNLVSVTDVNEESGLFYIVMEFVNGTSAGSYLKEYIKSTGSPGLDEVTALDICIAATQGLAAAHAEGIIHRDIKPDNILIPVDKHSDQLLFKNAKLADLGLARSEDAGQSLTGAQSTMGTPGFMAPEQCMDAKRARKPADVFSMGATLFALLCGRPPFTGSSNMEVFLSTIQQPHTPLQTKRPDISSATAALVERCLQKKPEDRCIDGSELLDELNNARIGLGIVGAAHIKPVAAPPLDATLISPNRVPTQATASPAGSNAPTVVGTRRPPVAPPPPAPPAPPPPAAARPISAKPQAATGVRPIAAPKPAATRATKGPRLLAAGGIAALLLVAYMLFANRNPSASTTETTSNTSTASAATTATATPDSGKAATAAETKTNSEDAYRSAIQSARKAMKFGDLDNAESAYHRALKENPGDNVAEAGLREVQKQRTQLAHKADQATLAAQSDPEKQQALTDAMPLALEAERHNNAYGIIAALETPLNNLGSLEHPFKETAQTLLAKARSTLKTHRNFDDELLQADVLMEKKKYAEAKAAYQQAKLSDPTSASIGKADSGITAADAAMSHERYEKAMADGRSAVASMRYGQAISDFMRALTERPNDADAMQLMHDTRMKMMALRNGNGKNQGQGMGTGTGTVRGPGGNGQKPDGPPPGDGLPDGSPPPNDGPPPDGGPPNGGPPGGQGGQGTTRNGTRRKPTP